MRAARWAAAAGVLALVGTGMATGATLPSAPAPAPVELGRALLVVRWGEPLGDVAAGTRVDIVFPVSFTLGRARVECDLIGGRDLTGVADGDPYVCEDIDF